MVIDWKSFKLDELITKRNQGVNTTTEKVSYSDVGIPVIRANNIQLGRLSFDDCVYVDAETFERIKEPCKPQKGDVLYTNIGSQFGTAVKVTSDFEFAIAWNVLRIQVDSNLDADFLVYLLNNPKNKAFIQSLNSSSTMPFVSGKVIGDIEFDFPSISYQLDIVNKLKPLDDKIELNRKTNQTLEQMAQAIFKSWFVDFDPVFDNALASGVAVSDFPEALQKKAEQRQQVQQQIASGEVVVTPLPEDIRQLFPSEFEQTNLGYIPKGWNIGNFDKLMVLQRGFDLPKSKRTDGKYPLIASSGQDGTHCEFKVEGPGVVTGRSGKLGEVTFVNENYWPLNTTLWVKEYSLSNPYHAYFFLKTLPLEEFNAGSAVPTLNRNHVHGHKCLLPNKEITDKFETIVKKWFEKIIRNEKSIETTEKLRNTLLPKLISGEINVNSTQ